ncbi:MAG: metallophosphoesterase [Candidatus Gracilibacteria bacterium]|nr:metallophosphoesterase [Candidatus Gracilibacteria bacterium]
MKTRIKDMGNKTVKELLEDGKINVVCVGDYLHTEDEDNWRPTIFETYDNGNIKMDSKNDRILTEFGKYFETLDSKNRIYILRNNIDKLSNDILDKYYEFCFKLHEKEFERNIFTLELLGELSDKYPNFYMCRGNHDFTKEGNARKYAYETADLRGFIVNKYGNDFLDLWDSFENQLGIIATQKKNNLIVSHTFGKHEIDKELVKKRDEKTEKILVLSDNQKCSEVELETSFQKSCSSFGYDPNMTKWIIGHRRIDDLVNYESQIGGKLLQINDKYRQLVGFIKDGNFTAFDVSN